MPMMRGRWISTYALVLVLAGCAMRSTGGGTAAPLMVRPAHVSEAMLSCSEATRAASDALLRMGYTITALESARAGKPGKVVGTRDTGWAPGVPQAGDLHTATVTVTCSDTGAEFDAVTDEGMSTQLNFPKRFASALKEKLNVKPVHSVRNAPPPQGLIVNVEPKRSADAVSEFGRDLPGAGITPVKIAIINRSTRRYGFERSQVRLVTVQGHQEENLSSSVAASQIGNAAARAQIEAVLAQKEI